jgi:hypothetical protein
VAGSVGRGACSAQCSLAVGVRKQLKAERASCICWPRGKNERTDVLSFLWRKSTWTLGACGCHWLYLSSGDRSGMQRYADGAVDAKILRVFDTGAPLQ